MPLNLDDNKRPYFKQLNLDETFDEIQNYVNNLEGDIPSPSSDVTVNQLITTATASVGSLVISNTASIATSNDTTDAVLTINKTTGKVSKKGTSYKEINLSAAQIKTLYSAPVEILPALSVGSYYSYLKIIVEFAAGSVGFDTGDKSFYFYWEPNWSTFGALQSQNFMWATNKNLVAVLEGGCGYSSLESDVYQPYQIPSETGRLGFGSYGYDSTVGNGTMKIKVFYETSTWG